MLVPLSWLKEFVDIDLPVDELAQLMTNAGLEIESIRRIGIDGADLEWDRALALLGRVVKVEQHPDADKLVLAHVDYGADEPKVVVTGAPNLYPFVGQDLSERTLYAPIIFEGAHYLNPYKNFKKTKLKGKALRGIYNDAMVCAEDELGIGEDHDGIILIEPDESWGSYCTTMPLAAGTPLQDVLGDVVLEIAILPNIARCTSILGVAREVAALTGKRLRYPSWAVEQTGPSVDGRVTISTEDPELNPRFAALLIEGVEQAAPTPFWMKHRLSLVGQRTRGVLVDISNYVMFEMGQPNHAFDYDFLRKRADDYAPDGPIHIHTRLPEPDETLVTLDGTERSLPEHGILVTDTAGNLSLGGVMGGLNSEIEDHTTSVLLEAAAWNFINIRKTMTAMKMHTDAGYRFSRGVHPSQAILGARRAAEMMRALANGTVAQGEIDHYFAVPEPVVVELPISYIKRWNGLDLDSAEIKALLERLEFEVEGDGDSLQVTVPDHRMDVEGKHDLAEEVARMVGYDNIPTTVLADTLPPQRGNAQQEAEERIVDALAGLGLQEVRTYRLTTVEQEAKTLIGAPDDRPYVTLINPATQERVVMRHSLLSSVLETVVTNSRFVKRIAVFELSKVFIDVEEVLPDEQQKLAMVLTGQRQTSGWDGGSAELLDFFDLKGNVESLLAKLNVAASYEVAEHPSYRPGRTAAVLVNGKQIGIMGELHPLVVEQLDMRVEDEQPVLAAEFDVDTLIQVARDRFQFAAIGTYPAVLEDLAFVVDETVSAETVAAAIRKAGGFLLKEVELFDLYRGDNLPEGQKSLAYHLTFQSPDKTLKDKDVAKLRKKIIGQLKRIGAALRE